MVSKLKLELAKVLLLNKRNRIYKIIGSLIKINDFIFQAGDDNIVLENILSEVKIIQIRKEVYQLFCLIESEIHTNLRMDFHFFSDEFRHKTIACVDDLLDQLMSNLQYDEIQKVEDAIVKIDKNIEKLNQ